VPDHIGDLKCLARSGKQDSREHSSGVEAKDRIAFDFNAAHRGNIGVFSFCPIANHGVMQRQQAGSRPLIKPLRRSCRAPLARMGLKDLRGAPRGHLCSLTNGSVQTKCGRLYELPGGRGTA
jgi:hypothetical protein